MTRMPSRSISVKKSINKIPLQPQLVLVHSPKEIDSLECSITSCPFVVKLLCSLHDPLYDWNMQFQQISFVLVLYV